MTQEEFKEYASENACVVEGNIIRNVINGRWTRIDNSFDETSDLQTVHHVCVLGIEAPPDLEDLYNVYSPKFYEAVDGNL